MGKEEAILSEELEEVTEDADGSDRRDFLKTAAKAAGAMAMFSVAGALVGDKAEAQDIPEEVGGLMKKSPTAQVRNMKMNIANKSNSRQISFSGQGLGKALQAQGLIPSEIKGTALNRASIIIHFKW